MFGQNTKLEFSTCQSTFGFILLVGGAVIGLTDFMELPLLIGLHHGGNFFLLYILFIFIIAVPTLMGEMMLGRRGQLNAISSIKLLCHEFNFSPLWQLFPWIGMASLLLILTLYSISAGWSIHYLLSSLLGNLTHLSKSDTIAQWNQLLASMGHMLFGHTVFLLITGSIVALGVNRGLERFSKISLPLFFFGLLALFVYATQSPGFGPATRYLLSVDFTNFDLQTVWHALGAAFFTLSIGGGSMLIYGGYLPVTARLGRSLLLIGLLEIFFSILIAWVIFTFVFHYKFPLQPHENLLFTVLPFTLSNLQHSHWLLPLSFFSILLAALTSAIAILEAPTRLVIERFDINRPLASFSLVGIIWLVSLPIMIQLDVLLEFLDHVVIDVLVPISALGFSLIAGWKISKEASQLELDFDHDWAYAIWQFLIRYIVPTLITIILIGSFYRFFNASTH